MTRYEFAIFEGAEDNAPIKGTTFTDPKAPETIEINSRLDLLHQAGYTEAHIRFRPVHYGDWTK